MTVKIILAGLLFLAVVGCTSTENNLTFICEGNVDGAQWVNGQWVNRETGRYDRKFISFKNKKAGGYECSEWTEQIIRCQSDVKKPEGMVETPEYMLKLDRETGAVYEARETDVERFVFSGTCMALKGSTL